jgi:hypothetical protein
MNDGGSQPKLAIALVWISALIACSVDEPSVIAGKLPAGGQPDAGSQLGGGAPDAGGGAPGGGAASDANAGYPTDAANNADANGGMANCAARAVEAKVTSVVEPADIIFAIDSSGSMDDEIEFVQSQMNRFSQQISASGIDVRVILIAEEDAICIAAPLGSGRCPEDTKLPGYLHIDEKVGSDDGLNVILDSYEDWSSQLRANASKSFVIITDDEATDGPNDSAAEFTANLLALDAAMFAKWTFNGIFVQQECDLGEEVGEVYADLVAQTQGVSGDLCLQDFQPVFDRLSEKIVTSSTAEIECEWDIPAPPAGETLDFGSVNIRYTDKAGTAASLGKVPSAAECPNFRNGWHYDDAQNPKAIVACPQSCTALRTAGVAKVEVLLGCKSEPPPVL